jgi:hypothetical protein
VDNQKVDRTTAFVILLAATSDRFAVAGTKREAMDRNVHDEVRGEESNFSGFPGAWLLSVAPEGARVRPERRSTQDRWKHTSGHMTRNNR